MVEKVLFQLYVFTQQAILSAYCLPGTAPGGDTKMSKRVPSLREVWPGEGGRELNK